MKIYELLLYARPQTLIDLDNYQREHFNCGIEVRREKPAEVHFDCEIEDLEEINREMRKPPSRSRSRD